jgi:[ribosomal protein S5]-alanine N-acetyltransferase
MLVALRTRRLLLRPFEPDDAGPFHQYANDPAVAGMMVGLQPPYPTELAPRWITYVRQAMADGAAFEFAVIEREGGRFAGLSGLVRIDRVHLSAELAYWIAPPLQGRGYATEATGAVVHFAFSHLKLERVWARTLARNRGSARVLERLGFQAEGRLRGEVRKDGIREDTLYFGLLASDPLPPVEVAVRVL